MDVKMEDVQKSPDTNEATVVTVTEAPSIAVVDGWIDSLMTCKQLSEADVQRLCDKVCRHAFQSIRPIRLTHSFRRVRSC